jgi:hypothetical protein
MNCKQGDIALVTSGASAGIMVTCLEALPVGWQRDDLPRGYHQPISVEAGPLWRVDRPIDWGHTPESRRYRLPTRLCVVPDKFLMPIRPNDDQDEAHEIEPVRAHDCT